MAYTIIQTTICTHYTRLDEALSSLRESSNQLNTAHLERVRREVIDMRSGNRELTVQKRSAVVEMNEVISLGHRAKLVLIQQRIETVFVF